MITPDETCVVFPALQVGEESRAAIGESLRSVEGERMTKPTANDVPTTRVKPTWFKVSRPIESTGRAGPKDCLVAIGGTIAFWVLVVIAIAAVVAKVRG